MDHKNVPVNKIPHEDLSEYEYKLRKEKRSLWEAIWQSPFTTAGVIGTCAASVYGMRSLMNNDSREFSKSLGYRARGQFVTLMLFLGAASFASAKQKYWDAEPQNR